ncbi:hypothetical protein EZS27_001814 [termite gut metagenome]|uniref:Alpha-2-macroglobulin domain-containing protein n=1 Tax=termite gut metagenome TaxID=433724 RepID=A0A5J4SX75_9ZZZZ
MVMRKIVILLFLCLFGGWTLPSQAQSFDKLWKQVEQTEKQGLPQTVIKLIDNIFREAEAEKNSPQMLKAYIWQAEYQKSLTPDSFYVHLADMEHWANTAPVSIDRSILHSLVAGIYADYVYYNSWQLRNNKKIVDDEQLTDIREWSGNMFVQKVLEHTRMALKDSLQLLDTSTKTYIPFVVTNKTSDYYGHDMYHLLTLRGTNALSRVLWDKDSATAEAYSLFHAMIDAYRKRNNQDAVLLATLDSLNWNRNNDISEKVLNKLIAGNESREICAEAYLIKAQQANNKRKYTEALQICDEAITKYSKYERINALKSLKHDILKPALSISSPRKTYSGAKLDLKINHRNLSSFTVEYYKVNLSATSPLLNKQPDKSFYRKYCGKVDSQHLSLSPSSDYSFQDTVITIKAPSKGVYLMRITPPDGKVEASGRFLFITDLQVLIRALPDNQCEIAVLDAESGKPVSDALIRLFTETKGDFVEMKTLPADNNGKAQFSWTTPPDTYRYFTAEKGDDTAMPFQNIYKVNNSGDEKSVSRMLLLTDRSLYRPGQTVYVKGIAYYSQVDTANVVTEKDYTLTLTDGNNREIGKREVRTNDFGSFTAEFVLPFGGLNGEYYLKTEQGAGINIRVEEYKRPTFDIVFAPQESTYRLGDSLQVKGTIKTYSGVPLKEVPVKYTFTRRSFTWLMFRRDETLLASGTVAPDEAGEFSIPVHLQADTNDGFYIYGIEVAATNAAGETQTSTTSIAAGSRSLLLSAKIEKKICKEQPGNAIFLATNLIRKPVNTEVEYKLFPVITGKEYTADSHPIHSGTFTTNTEMSLSTWQYLPSGAYKLTLSAQDEQGRKADYEQEITLFSINDTRPPVKAEIWYHPVHTEFNASQPASFVFGTSEKDAYILTDVFCGNKRLESKILQLSDTLVHFNYPYKEDYDKGLDISFAFVKESKFYQQEVHLTKKVPEKELKITREVFRDKLLPGQKEEWKFTVKTPQGLPAIAEMLALMYDASLDKIWKNNRTFHVDYPLWLPSIWSPGYMRYNDNYCSFWFPSAKLTIPRLAYDALQTTPLDVVVGYGGKASRSGIIAFGTNNALNGEIIVVGSGKMKKSAIVDSIEKETLLPDASYDLRTNFSETAFFYPQLRTNEHGEITFSFTVPESLTRWNFQGYAHTKGMWTGTIESETVTSKDFMLTPNLPRFVRTGDKTSVSAAITNLTGKNLVGTVIFTLFDPVTEKVITVQKQTFAAEAGKAEGVNFLFAADDKYDILGCRIIAEAGGFSDGEQHLLLVLSNKEHIVETLAMPVRGKEKKEFSLESLFNKNSKTATNRRLTIEFSGNPAWYAVQALPALSLPMGDNAISWATVYYANTLAAYIINANPRIKMVFDSWKLQGGTKETFLSNLQKNQDVKNILLEESPWLAEAISETEQMQRIVTLFDLNNIQNTTTTALVKLGDLQHSDGAWSWYKGMEGSRHVTEFVVQTLVRLSELTGKPLDENVQNMLQSAFGFLHKEIVKEYRYILQEEEKGNKYLNIPDFALQYLYLIAVSGETLPKGDAQKAYTYFFEKASKSYSLQPLSEKALLAVIFQKVGRIKEAEALIASLKEHAVQRDEQGMFFAFNESPYSWKEMKVPFHVSVMEAFDMAGDSLSVEEMKLWLLKQKQTQQWNSPIATVDAVYALLYRNNNLLENRGDVQITLGNKIIKTVSPDETRLSGLGYVKEIITAPDVFNQKKITVEKHDAGIAWGAVYAQYKEDIDKITRQGKELQADKRLYVEKVVNGAKQLQPVIPKTKLAVGDKVISRITIHLDRPMDFVQLKDQYGACFEPIETLSGYRRSNGVNYYVAVKNASVNFFFDTLNKGVYVLEYAYRVSRPGVYEMGLAVVQSAYTPEYSGHSGSMRVEIE